MKVTTLQSTSFISLLILLGKIIASFEFSIPLFFGFCVELFAHYLLWINVFAFPFMLFVTALLFFYVTKIHTRIRDFKVRVIELVDRKLRPHIEAFTTQIVRDRMLVVQQAHFARTGKGIPDRFADQRTERRLITKYTVQKVVIAREIYVAIVFMVAATIFLGFAPVLPYFLYLLELYNKMVEVEYNSVYDAAVSDFVDDDDGTEGEVEWEIAEKYKDIASRPWTDQQTDYAQQSQANYDEMVIRTRIVEERIRIDNVNVSSYLARYFGDIYNPATYADDEPAIKRLMKKWILENCLDELDVRFIDPIISSALRKLKAERVHHSSGVSPLC